MKMKFKKILSVVMAVAMLMTMFSVTAFAAETVIAEGTFTAEEYDWGVANTIYNIPTEGLSVTDAIVVEVVADASVADSSAWAVSFSDPGWDWNKYVVGNAEGVTATVADIIEAQELTAITDIASIPVQVNNIAAGDSLTYKITVDGDYVPPTVGVWLDNGDGSYSVTIEESNAPDFTIPVDNKENAESLSVDITIKNGNGYENGGIGANVAGTWTSGPNWDVDVSTLTWEFDGELSSDPLFQVWYAAAGATITLSNITVNYKGAETTIEPNVIYVQETEAVDGVKSVRFVQMISEELAAETESVTYTISNGSAEAVATSAACYSAVKAAGAEITADDGYVFVAYAVTGVPADVELTCAMTLN